MRGRRRIRAIALLLLTAAGFPTRASAEPEHIRIQFSAPPRCPDGTAFMRALRRRTGRFQLFSGTEQTRVFVVTITRTDASVSGRLEIQGPGTETSLRNVSGSSCDEVMAALALMTALAIDPSARWRRIARLKRSQCRHFRRQLQPQPRCLRRRRLRRPRHKASQVHPEWTRRFTSRFHPP
jgi:hypothetical protein